MMKARLLFLRRAISSSLGYTYVCIVECHLKVKSKEQFTRGYTISKWVLWLISSLYLSIGAICLVLATTYAIQVRRIEIFGRIADGDWMLFSLNLNWKFWWVKKYPAGCASILHRTQDVLYWLQRYDPVDNATASFTYYFNRWIWHTD